ncbi:hypothetical protein EDB84DRAFT_1442340 [Lactarius hengduanensis]|nr:hypothetical protein EDB84DRAFT_1442340 [Lactarius hengduanensis]
MVMIEHTGKNAGFAENVSATYLGWDELRLVPCGFEAPQHWHSQKGGYDYIASWPPPLSETETEGKDFQDGGAAAAVIRVLCYGKGIRSLRMTSSQYEVKRSGCCIQQGGKGHEVKESTWQRSAGPAPGDGWSLSWGVKCSYGQHHPETTNTPQQVWAFQSLRQVVERGGCRERQATGWKHAPQTTRRRRLSDGESSIYVYGMGACSSSRGDWQDHRGYTGRERRQGHDTKLEIQAARESIYRSCVNQETQAPARRCRGGRGLRGGEGRQGVATNITLGHGPGGAGVAF